MAAYSMSKFALRAFGSALRRELAPSEVFVSVLEPDFYGTPLVDETKLLENLEASWARTSKDIKEGYTEEQVNTLMNSVKALLELTHPDPTPVVDKMLSAVSILRKGYLIILINNISLIKVNTSREPEHFYRLCSVPEAISFYPLEMFPSELIDHHLIGKPLILACKVLRVLNRCGDLVTRAFGAALDGKLQ